MEFGSAPLTEPGLTDPGLDEAVGAGATECAGGTAGGPVRGTLGGWFTLADGSVGLGVPLAGGVTCAGDATPYAAPAACLVSATEAGLGGRGAVTNGLIGGAGGIAGASRDDAASPTGTAIETAGSVSATMPSASHSSTGGRPAGSVSDSITASDAACAAERPESSAPEESLSRGESTAGSGVGSACG
jgi:hypothetical protein